MELQRAGALIDATSGMSLAEMQPWQMPRAATSEIAEAEWACYDGLMMQVSVMIPLQEVSLAYIAGMVTGTILRSVWAVSEDVPLVVGDTFLANVCFEPAGASLGVRISDFAPRTPPVDLRRVTLHEASMDPVHELDLLHVLEVRMELLFGTMKISLNDLTRLALGDIVRLNRPVNGPVEITSRGRVIASGTLLFVDGCYAVQIEKTAPMSRVLQQS